MFQRKKRIFWGTGKIGINMLRCWQDYGCSPDFLCNNDSITWGQKLLGVDIISPEQLREINDVEVYITCAAVNDVRNQLLEMGIPADSIIKADTINSFEVVSHMIDYDYSEEDIDKIGTREDGCYIDLSHGMILGGVERWSYSIAEELAKEGIKGYFLVPDKKVSCAVECETFPAKFLGTGAADRVLPDGAYFLLQGTLSCVICNFPENIFLAACIAKRKLKNRLKLIAVVHSDDENFYRTYSQFGEEIDYCLSISQKTKKELISHGFPEEKIRDLFWKIPCNTEKREYLKGGVINLGYSGRIAIEAKRADLLVKIAYALKQENVKFKFNIVGSGPYESELKQKVEEFGLSDFVKVYGYMEHEKIFDFWKQQDVCVGCSDYEGHSISHSEAMSCGVVPVITNTSGAEDDVLNGVNGYIVDIGDVNAIVGKIKKLSEQKNLLETMGPRNPYIIAERNKKMDFSEFWEELVRLN